LAVPYEAPQGRRVNAIGGYLSRGVEAGRFEYAAYASLPASRGGKRRKSPEEVAACYGLSPQEVGPIDSARFLAFVWRLAGRPALYPGGWRRARPLFIVLDNYSVHKSQPVQGALPGLEAANVFLWYLPSYSPELSDIEPVWHVVKHHEMPQRSQTDIRDQKRAVEQALARKAEALRARHDKTTRLLCATA
jgi:hypothetical protein